MKRTKGDTEVSKRLLSLFALLTVMAVTALLAGCPPKETADVQPVTRPVTQPVADATPEKQWKVAFSNATFEDPWREVQNEEMKLEAAKHPEIEFLPIGDGENKNDRQIETVQSFVQQGIDLLIISPREADALTSTVKEVYESGIPVILIDRNINEPSYTCFIGGDNVKIGEAAGNLVVGHFGDKPAKIVEIEGVADATPTKDRKQGFEDVVAQHGNLEIIFDQPANYLRADATEVMSAALTACPEIDCVYAHNDEMALGAYQAAKAAGREDEMIIIGIDSVQTEAIKAVMDGQMHATYFYPTCGKEAIQYALKILNGEEVDKEITLGTTEVTAGNAADYYEEGTTLVIQG